MAARNNNYSKLRILQGEERIGAASRASAYLAVEDFSAAGPEPILTVEKLAFGECVLDQGRKEDHDVIFFAENSVPGLPVVRPLIINSTNRKTLFNLFGDLSAAALEGKRVQLFVDPRVKAVGGGYTKGIRIRPRVPAAPAPIQQNGQRPVQSGPSQINQYQPGPGQIGQPAPMMGADPGFGGGYGEF